MSCLAATLSLFKYTGAYDVIREEESKCYRLTLGALLNIVSLELNVICFSQKGRCYLDVSIIFDDIASRLNVMCCVHRHGRGHSVSYHFAEPPQDKLPKAVKPGDLFTGEIPQTLLHEARCAP